MTSDRLLAGALDPLEGWAALDRPAEILRTLVGRLIGRQTGNVLNGVQVGHPVHPVLAQASLGFFLSSGLLDARGEKDAAAALIAAGLVSAAPTVAAGLADWQHGHEQQQRVGLVHAAANVGALMLYAGSLRGRRRGGTGRSTAYAGLAILGVGGYLGGHLAFRQALGPNHVEHVPHRAPADWTPLCRRDEVPADGSPVQRMLGDQPLVVLADGDRVRVLSDVCSHLSAPLHEGEVRDGCLVCPWHGSTFRINNGAVVQGPATAAAPVFDVRVDDDVVLVRLPGAS